MTSSDVDDVARLINQLHQDQPGVIRPERVRQGWRAFVARNDEGGAVGFLLGRSSTTGWLTKARERLSSSSLTSRCAASRLARSWSNAGSRGSLPKEYHSGSRARDRTPSASTNNAVSQRCPGPLARVGSRMRPIQALNSAGGEADSVRELSVTAAGRCSANDRSAAAATRAVIRPSSR
jgi:hypothetical protein